MPATIQGNEYLFNQALQDKTFYVMLLASGIDQSATLETAASYEIAATGGYARLGVTLGAAQVVDDGNVQTIMQTAQFTAVGANIGPFITVAIVDAQTGNYGNLLFYYTYPTEVTIIEGTSATIVIPWELEILQ